MLPHLYRNQVAELFEEAAREILGTGDSITIQNHINNSLNAIREEAKRRPDGPKPPKPPVEDDDE